MSYRKIEVSGKIFEYSIGRTHTKIRGVGAFKNEDIGHHRTGEKYAWLDCPDGTLQVRPKDIANFVKLRAVA